MAYNYTHKEMLDAIAKELKGFRVTPMWDNTRYYIQIQTPYGRVQVFANTRFNEFYAVRIYAGKFSVKDLCTMFGFKARKSYATSEHTDSKSVLEFFSKL